MKRTNLFLNVLVALSFCAGCVNTRVIENTRAPEIIVDDSGAITFNNQRVKLDKLAKTVKRAGIDRDQEVNILVPENFDRALRNRIYAAMIRSGYTRTVFVSNRKASAVVTGKKP